MTDYVSVTPHASPQVPWHKRPRLPLTDLFDTGRWKLGILLLDLGLVLGGFAALTGLDSDGSRVLGGLALIAGLVLTFILMLYIRRPVSEDA